jgi:hypothetical protein
LLVIIALPLIGFYHSRSAKSEHELNAPDQEPAKVLDSRTVSGRMNVSERQLAVNSELADVAKRDRLANLQKCVDLVTHQDWAALGVQQIPATVIDKGVLRHVPYMSFRAGEYELNVYGDPLHPAGVEIGVYQSLLRNRRAKSNCIQFICRLLSIQEDRQVVSSLDLDKDSEERDGMTFEVTPETDEDAYGGWWVSAYTKSVLDASRASPSELAAITTSRVKNEPNPGDDSRPTAGIASPGPPESAAAARPASPASAAYLAAHDGRRDGAVEQSRWLASDFKRARQPGRDVYVRDYVRKNGTYVHSHTRSSGRR